MQSLREKSQSEQSALNRRVEQLGTGYHAGTVLPEQKTLWPPGPVLNCLSYCYLKWKEYSLNTTAINTWAVFILAAPVLMYSYILA